MDLTPPHNFICSSNSFTHENNMFQGIFSLPNPLPFRQTTDASTYTQQQIERRTSWEHEKLLFSADYESENFIQKNENNIYAEESLQNNLKFTQEIQKQKQYQLHQAKTPDLIPESKLNGLDNFLLENKIQKEQLVKKQWHCSCKKSKCLKMYCECFRNGEICEGCECCDCTNTQQRQEQRKRAKLKIEKKQPTAFIDIFKYKGCKCTKSNCEKGYCECFANGLMCGKYCKCIDCNNCTKFRKSKQEKSGQKGKAKRKV